MRTNREKNGLAIDRQGAAALEEMSGMMRMLSARFESARGLALRGIDWWIPEQSGPDAESLHRRGRMLVLVSAMSLFVLIWTVGYQSLFGSPRFVLAALATSVLPMACPIAVRLGISIETMTSVGVGLMFLANYSLTLATQGHWPGGLFFLPLVPAVAVLMVSIRSGALWAAGVMAALGFSWLLFPSIPADSMSVVSANDITAANYRVASLITLAVFSIAAFYSNLHQRALDGWKRTSALHELGEERFRAMSENAYDLISEMDERGKYTFVSPNFEEVFGVPLATIRERGMFDAIHPEDRKKAIRMWQRVLEKGAAEHERFRFATAMRGERSIETSMRSYVGPNGELRVVSVCRDVTQQLARQADDRRQETLAAMGIMAAGAAHQLRSPLASMIAAAELAKLHDADSEDDFPEVARQALTSIEGEATRCSQILRSMLDFTREDTCERWIESIEPVLKRAVAAVQLDGSLDDVEIVMSFSPEPTFIMMSPIEIEQVMINLLRNSIEAGAGIIVMGTTIYTDGNLRITVSDDGRGMSEEARVHSFEPFFTTHPESGSGLGLHVARSIVQDHFGEIRLIETGPQGTVIVVELPLADTVSGRILQ